MYIQRINTDTLFLVEELFDKYRVFYEQPSDIALAKHFLHQRLANNESVIFAAIDNESGRLTPAGFTQLYPLYSSVRAQKDWILNDLYVESGYRKRGVGRQLITTAIQFAKEQGARFVQLETAETNTTAQSLYEAMGFEKCNPIEGEFVYRIAV